VRFYVAGTVNKLNTPFTRRKTAPTGARAATGIVVTNKQWHAAWLKYCDPPYIRLKHDILQLKKSVFNRATEKSDTWHNERGHILRPFSPGINKYPQ
jgi:hypothetical protein